MSNLVKGRKVGGDVEAQAAAAEKLFRDSIKKSHTNPQEVIRGLSAPFAGSLGKAFGGQNYALQQFAQKLDEQLGSDLAKSFGVGGISSVPLVPYDLSQAAKLIYPVYSPLRNRIPRTQGQGTSHEAKIITGVSGALPGSLGGQVRTSINELLSAGSTLGSSYPVGGLPSQGTQTAVDVNVPYRFHGLTEQVSWLAQFSGQGFDDAAGLASLILLQEMMMAEERAIIGATATALSAPSAPVSGTARSAGATETGLSGVTTNVYVRLTAVNYYGETAPSSATSVAATNGQVVDVTLPALPAGALAFNIYVSTGASEPANGSRWLFATTGSSYYTLQGALPTSGSNPPASDTGTNGTNDIQGMIPTIAGQGSTSIYPSGFKGSYVNLNAKDVFSTSVLNNALLGMWNGFLADPDEIWTDATGAQSLSNAISAQGGAASNNYRFNVDQSGQTGARFGLAVSEIVNPHTRKVIDLKVHPYIPQGTAMFTSWTLPHPWANVSNVWERVNVQDYLSISWPVIDVTFKFSLFWYGALFSPAVQYNGLVQGLNKQLGNGTSTPYV